jgi:hypothetical protein
MQTYTKFRGIWRNSVTFVNTKFIITFLIFLVLNDSATHYPEHWTGKKLLPVQSLPFTAASGGRLDSGTIIGRPIPKRAAAEMTVEVATHADGAMIIVPSTGEVAAAMAGAAIAAVTGVTNAAAAAAVVLKRKPRARVCKRRKDAAAALL